MKNLEQIQTFQTNLIGDKTYPTTKLIQQLKTYQTSKLKTYQTTKLNF